MVHVEVFVGKVLNPAQGVWITLPVTNEALEEQIKTLEFGDSEFEIVDMKHDIPLNLGNYTDVYQLNQDLKVILGMMESGRDYLLYTAYAFKDNNLGYALELLEKGNYEFYENIINEDCLGRRVFQSGRLGDPKNISYQVERYLDYEKIGHDWVSNGCILYPNFYTAMMELSSS